MAIHKRKVGLLGGTFDPIHKGHLLLGEYAQASANLDCVMFLPSAVSYFKENTVNATATDRLEMTRLAVEDHPSFLVCDIEVRRGGYTYTFETLEELALLHPDWELYFILGADSLFTIENWREPERIFAASSLLVTTRNDITEALLEQKQQELTQKYDARIMTFPFPKLDISSTNIRTSLRN
ncbi:MAG: nicotinate-nucleotide adenylyltransferase, partial [Lachnospiraceae bacterium]|nr:nicotinate-nucleotide adenylyltransferase [Lachnospiraceae bacterium]